MGYCRSIFQRYDVYWLSSYVKAFRIHGDGEPLLFYYCDDDNRGINVVMKRDIAKDKHFTGKLSEGEYFDFATPYGYGGWIVEGTNSEISVNTEPILMPTRFGFRRMVLSASSFDSIRC